MELLVELLLFVLVGVLWLGCLVVGWFAFTLAFKPDELLDTAPLEFGERWICGMVGVLCLVIVLFLTFFL